MKPCLSKFGAHDFHVTFKFIPQNMHYAENIPLFKEYTLQQMHISTVTKETDAICFSMRQCSQYSPFSNLVFNFLEDHM